jgi:hypothetical protein
VEEQPELEGGLSLVVNSTGLAAESTTLESGSSLSSQASKKIAGGVATKDVANDSSYVDSDIAKELTEETKGTAFNGQISRVGESRAHHTGEQDERRTHVEFCINECIGRNWKYQDF